MKIELTVAEVSHLMTLLRDAKDEGSYYGNRDQYWARAKRIEAALAKPEAREWRASWVSWRGREERICKSYDAARLQGRAAGGNFDIESRTPAGPWERAK